MHNKKREKHLGGRCVQRPPEVIPLGVQAERQQHGTRLHKTRQNNDHNRDHEGHIQQNATCYPQGAVAGQKARDEVGVLDAVNERADITVIISDNLTTGMTGGQDSAGTGRLEQICAGIGVDPAHIRTVVPLPKNREEMKAVIREEIAHRGVSVIIPRRECIQTAKRHNAAKK